MSVPDHRAAEQTEMERKRGESIHQEIPRPAPASVTLAELRRVGDLARATGCIDFTGGGRSA